jgi:hypothetical protein
MKKCPKCNRTYADDGFTFCLEDGALLSAPYDPEEEKPVSTIRSSGPPPTVALPSSGSDSISESGKEVKATPMPPTIASPRAHPDPKDTKSLFSQYPNTTPRKNSRLAYIGIAFLTLIVVGGISLYVLGQAQCSKVNVTIKCSPTENYATCWLQANETQSSVGNSGPAISSLRAMAALQLPASSQLIDKTTWTASSGKVSFQSQYYAQIDTPGLAGREIKVTATANTNQWFCSRTASTSFVVPTPAAR